jgi:hypothetical protein
MEHNVGWMLLAAAWFFENLQTNCRSLPRLTLDTSVQARVLGYEDNGGRHGKGGLTWPEENLRGEECRRASCGAVR